MVQVIAPCTNHIVSVIILPYYVQWFIWQTKKSGQLELDCSGSVYAQLMTPANIEKELRTLLKQGNMPHAFVAIAIALHDKQARTIASHELLQCQLLAINTPFHCAGITTYALAQELALTECATIPQNTSSLISDEDFLCSIGLYLMARKSP